MNFGQISYSDQIILKSFAQIMKIKNKLKPKLIKISEINPKVVKQREKQNF